MTRALLLFDGIHLEGGLGTGAFYALFGFVFVFVGITLLIVILSLLGKGMSKVNEKKAQQTAKKSAENVASAPVVEAGIPPEVVAAITAAVAAYMEQEQSKCEFVVRRIKRY